MDVDLVDVDIRRADAGRIARGFRRRLADGVVRRPGRTVWEAVLALTLAGFVWSAEVLQGGGGVLSLVLVAAVALLSAVRHALPATALVATAPLAGGWNTMTTLLLICVSWSAGRRIREPWRVVAAFGAACVLYTLLSVVTDLKVGAAMALPVSVWLSLGFFLPLSVVPALVARYRTQRRALLDALRQNNEQLKREQAMVAREARLLERNRIAHDMHDSLGHQLALISVHAGALQVDPELTENQREAVRILRGASVTAMAELREAVGVLHDDRGSGGQQERPERLEPPQGQEGHRSHQGVRNGSGAPAPRTLAAVDGLVGASRAAGTAVELDRTGERRPLAPAADHEAYRVVQEGLTNAHKHAPGAPIRLALRYEPDSLVVEVTNGPVPGGAPEVPPEISGGQGLKGLRERVGLVGGMVHTGPTEDGGFRIAGMLPYGEEGGDAGRGSGDAGRGSGAHGTRGATSVVPGSDFRGQRRPGPVGDGGAVINRADPQRELTTFMSTKKNVAIGCGVIAVLLVVGVVALGIWGVGALKDELKKADISPSVYEAAKVGDPEADVQATLPKEDSLLTSDLANQGPMLPEGATCRHFTSDKDTSLETITVFRFCFQDGKLAVKETYQAE